MGNMSNVIASVKHLKAFDDVFKERFENMDLSAAMMYVIDNVPSEALYHLADQFGVLGYKGWILCQTDADKRELIKKAIDLQAHAGTVYAIKEAVKAVGFDSVKVVEHVGVDYDGSYLHDDNITYSGGNWATFRVKIGLPNDIEVDVAVIDNLVNFINEYKNARSHLLDVTFLIIFTDTITYNEFIDLGEGVEDILTEGLYYNGVSTYSGGSNYNKAADVCSLTITNVSTLEVITDEF